MVSVFDGKGEEWLAKVGEKQGEKVVLVPIQQVHSAKEEVEGNRRARLHVAVSLLKRHAMDWMIEKLCELDVASLQPLICKRTVAQASSLRSIDPPARWERIALAAAKQSGRNVPMAFAPITPLNVWLERERPPTLNCFAHQSPDALGLGEWLGGRAGMGLPVQVAVGPEGGWTPGEVEMFLRAGFMAVSLGPLVLRAETAALTVAAACRVML